MGHDVTLNFDAYLKALAATPVDDKTEHTDRGALERLLKEAAAEADERLHVRHEPRGDKDGGGRPDFMVKRDARVVGYVENKQIDDSLDKLIRSEQVKKYQKLSENLLLTDYLDFVWLKKGQDPQRARLAHSTTCRARRWRLSPKPSRRSRNSCAPSSPRRPRTSAGARPWRSNWPPARPCCATS